jgi:2-polyprenyl-3-methyl-5-hydroxy-6-metoxy-1,4-benzoquinol methylase
MDLSEAFRALGDPTRLRIMKLLSETKLNVTEVMQVVGVAQSSVSHHLAKLKGLQLIREERQAGFTYYSLAIEPTDPRFPLIRLARDADDQHGDNARLTELLERREDRHTLNEKLLEPGQSWMLWSSALSSLLPPLDVVDFGCGTGVLSVELARWARRVTAIDRSSVALEAARARAKRDGRSNIDFVEADLHQLPKNFAAKDLVVISQSLHHVERPEQVLAEAARVLKAGGRLVLLELMPHDEQWVKARLGHHHLGFEPATLVAAMTAAGFIDVQLHPSARDGGSAFRAFLLTGTRSASRARKSPLPQ